MKCAHNKNQTGFTLVEISIAMIIIGLLIGGTFGGMKLVENMQVNKTVQDLKSFDSAGLTFKDIYGRLPGDLPNPSTRLPSCAAAPCSVGGNGNRRIGDDPYDAALSATSERFVFWQHLLAANLISNVTPTNDLRFGEGQPANPMAGGYRLIGFQPYSIMGTGQMVGKHLFWISERYSDAFQAAPTGTQLQDAADCRLVQQLDIKGDDGRPTTGRIQNFVCNDNPSSTSSNWANLDLQAAIFYTLAY
ncbi:prepilin-type N-terminal cleavage/methylation domain-containing protein [Sphingopyxis sp. Geo48]|uniref:type II secretion system protein n=1 Tax=Sphingopyxis sp. Geo48 TaxID=545241 RepID=UPI0024B657A8|nr:prepilin-type N-terminal cleavage/methylation domain-containing protein [Sphingopyxis sp. Geo48]